MISPGSFLAFVFSEKAFHPPYRSIYILIALLIVCVGCIILLSRERFANKLAGMSQRIRRPLFTKLTERVFKIQENLKRINSPFNLLLTVTISFCTWFSMTIALYLVILMLGIQVDFCHVPLSRLVEPRSYNPIFARLRGGLPVSPGLSAYHLRCSKTRGFYDITYLPRYVVCAIQHNRLHLSSKRTSQNS